ncbi:NAD(P)/FAD-dependent oxidoreductase [Neorhizobium lilium]|uniref:NAD(P)/FAD-dependent oxidoreductase n=1 Tax=Neorhizobium lilium TaxID=2503024 RepID=UPI0013E40E61|nr:FAD-dependent oxidoreductase [Neorhizobium lilium]
MPSKSPQIAVVGAGIIGCAIAYNLALRGANVVLVEEGPEPGHGVTGRAFGWVNVINGTPDNSNYTLWRKAIDEYRRLETVLPEAFSSARRGSLIWETTPEETEQLFDLHHRAGEEVELVKRDVLREWEPCLRHPPEHAVYSPRDLALDPAQLAKTLAAAAVGAGASIRFAENVLAVETANGRATALLTSSGSIPADIVVLAAGAGVNKLAAGLGIDIGLETSPAALLRYACSIPVVSRIVCAPRIEIRQARDNTLFIAKSFVPDGTDDLPQRMAETMLSVLREELGVPDDVAILDARVGHRPIFADRMPRAGFLPQIEGLYVAVGHPGVILAPLLGRLAAQEILDGHETGLMAFLPN